MNVLGIDSSLRCTGVAQALLGDDVAPAPHNVSSTRFETDAEEGLVALRASVRYIVGSTLKFAPKGPLLTVIEAPIIPRHGSGLALERAWLFGLLVDQLMIRGPVATVHPSTRALYATGDGRAEKPTVLAAMKAAYPTVTVNDHNEADALALVGMGARWLGSPVDGAITSKQAKAMRSAHWPDMEGSK